MKPRTTLILAVLAGGFFAYIWFVERHAPTTREGAESAAKVVSIEQGKINAISIQSGEAKLELSKKDGVWRIDQPISDRADSIGVSQLLSSLESLRHDSKIDFPASQEKEKLKEFGVAESDTRIKVKSDTGKETEVLLGKDSAVEGKVYARVQGTPAAFVINNSLRTQLTKKPDEFRDKKLSDTPPQQVQRLAIKTADGEIELERKNSHWEISKPLKARAADQKVNDLIAGILNANVSEFLPENPTPEQGLTEPRATLTLTVEGTKEPLTLKVGATPSGEANKEKSYTRLSNRPAITVLANSALDPLLKLRPNDVRDRKLARFEVDVVDRITFEPAEGAKIVLARKGEGWIRKDGDQEIQINETLPAKLLSSIQSTEVTNFVSDVATDLPKYGLEKPKMKVTLASFASQPTAETKAGERVLATLHFGTVEGDSGYARLEEEPFIIASPKTLLESVPTHPAQLQPLRLWDTKADSVTAIELTGESGTVKLEKSEGSWKAATGKGTPAPEQIHALLTTFSGLSTTRWFAPGETGEKAEDKPTKTLQLTLKEGEKVSTFSITVGRALGDEGYYAKASGKEGSFLLSKADSSSLIETALLKPEPKAEPAPTPEGKPAPSEAKPSEPAPKTESKPAEAKPANTPQ